MIRVIVMPEIDQGVLELKRCVYEVYLHFEFQVAWNRCVSYSVELTSRVKGPQI